MTGPGRMRMRGLLAAIAATLCCQPVWAIDFSPLPTAFSENFVGESSSPTNPEVDLLGTTGVVVNGSLIGGAAQLSIANDGIHFLDRAKYQLVDVENVFTLGSKVGIRAEFGNLALQSDGSVALAVGLSFVPIRAGLNVQVNAAVVLTQSAAGNSGTLRLVETDFVNPDGIGSVGLSGGASDAILQGAAVRIDLLVDGATNQLIGEVFVDGNFVAQRTSDLGAYDEHTLSEGFGLLAVQPPSFPSAASVDLVLLETYAQPFELTPFVNIDFASGFGTPFSAFGAAGGAGVWNNIEHTGVVPLNDVDGISSGATAQIDAGGFLSFGGGYSSDLIALFADYTSVCDPFDMWSLAVAGLDDGLYRVFVYAPSDPAHNSGNISIGGAQAIANLTGSPSPTLIEGVSWGSYLAIVQGGVLVVSAEGTGNVNCTSIAGLQIEIGQPITARAVPSLGGVALVGLAGLMLLLGGRRMT